MSAPGNRIQFLVDREALDVSRMTDIPWERRKVHSRGMEHPYIDLTSLEWWDKWRVAWTMIGGYSYTDIAGYVPDKELVH